jgi:hypothetical protein
VSLCVFRAPLQVETDAMLYTLLLKVTEITLKLENCGDSLKSKHKFISEDA